MKITKEFIVYLIIMIILIGLISLITTIISLGNIQEEKCESRCDEDGALAYEVFNYLEGQTCVCYYSDHIKSFKIGE